MSTRKITVSEYAREFNTSVQSVYQRIKRKTLNSVEEHGVKYVVIPDNTGSDRLNKGDDKGDKPKVQSEFKQLVKMIKRLQDQIDSKDVEIKRLTKKLEKCSKSKEDVLINYISELKQLRLPEPEEVIDVKPKKKKKKK